MHIAKNHYSKAKGKAMSEAGANRVKPDALPQDSEKRPIQVGSTTQYRDGADTPKTSPLAVAGTELELVTPKGALALIIKPRGNNMRHGKQDPLTGGANQEYAVLEPGNFLSIDVAGGTSVWVMQDSGAVTLDFHYVMI